jgi:hypothetical protein
VAEEDEQRAEESFIESEDEDGDGAGAGEVTAGNGDEGPDEKCENANEVDTAGGAVGELDEGGKGGVMLDDGSVAERPMVAASRAGAGGADSGSPDDDSDVVGEDSPGKAAERGGRTYGCGSGIGGSDHGGVPKAQFYSD